MKLKINNPVIVRVSENTFGPRTKSFGVRYTVLLNDDGDQFQFHFGRGGNNSRNERTYKVHLPADFGELSKEEQLSTVQGLLLKAGAKLIYPAGVAAGSFERDYFGLNEDGEFVF